MFKVSKKTNLDFRFRENGVNIDYINAERWISLIIKQTIDCINLYRKLEQHWRGWPLVDHPHRQHWVHQRRMQGQPRRQVTGGLSQF